MLAFDLNINLIKGRSIFKLLRTHQWIKNLFIFLPLFFGLEMTNADKYIPCIIAFVGFSFLASAVYVFNDLHDTKEDKLHPKKKFRPIASGNITKQEAIIIIGIFGLMGLNILLFAIEGAVPFYLSLCYLVLNIFYTTLLKHIPIVDITIISIGFIIRIYIGGAVTNIGLSHWIVLMTFLLALFLALAKRRDDVLMFLSTGRVTRKNIGGYNLDFLNSALTIMSSIIIVSYIMYAVSLSEKIPNLIITTFFVILGLLRYLQITFVALDSGEPTKILLKDKFIQIVLIGWISVFWILLYF